MIIRCVCVYCCEYFSVYCGEMSVGDIKFTFIIILLLLCVFYKSAHVMISVDTMWLSVSLPGHA